RAGLCPGSAGQTRGGIGDATVRRRARPDAGGNESARGDGAGLLRDRSQSSAFGQIPFAPGPAAVLTPLWGGIVCGLEAVSTLVSPAGSASKGRLCWRWGVGFETAF